MNNTYSLSYSHSGTDMSGSTSRGSLTKEGASEYDAEEGDFDEEDGSYNENKPRDFLVTTVRGDGYGGGGPSTTPHHSSNSKYANNTINNNAPFLPLQSHNYEPEESEIWRAHMTMIHIRNRGQWWTTSKLRKLKQWLLTFVIGVVQAVIASRCNSWSRKLSAIKFMHVRALLVLGLSYYENDENPEGSNYNDSWMMNYGGVEYYGDDGSSSSSNATMIGIEGQDTSEERFVFNNTNYTINASKEGMHSTTFSSSMNDSQLDLDAYWFNFGGSPFLAFLFYQTIFAFIASLFTYIEPVSAGSGIPEVKVYLNGVDIPRIMRAKTLVCRALGCIFSVASGFPVGMEGPMIHSGSVVAALVSQGYNQHIPDFRNDSDKRDFVSCGAAAGVASAFSSPIGGVLFSLEEGASYWSTQLTWRAFFCAMVTLATLYTIRNQDSKWGQTNVEKLFSLGEFTSIDGQSNFSVWELFIFAFVGCVGGLIGACFNAASEHMTIWRMRRVNHCKKRRVLEVILLSILVSSVSFGMSLLWNRCTDLPTDVQGWNNQQKQLMSELVPFQCVPGKEYNEVASLYLVDADVAIRQLFHFRETGTTDASTFSSAAVFLFFFPYVTLACVVYGISIPSGLLVPSLLSGAAFGRLFGHLLHMLDHTSGTFADSGTYALMGAAAMMGGFSRMTISVTVILLEATGNMQYVLPLMITVMAARFTGNIFNEGIYDSNIHLKKYPLLEQDVPSLAERHEIVAGQAMTAEVKCLRPVERVGVVYDLLRHTSHGNFPIIDTASSGILYGTTSRSMLCTLLQRRAFCRNKEGYMTDDYKDGFWQSKRLLPLVQWETIEKAYPNYPSIDSVELRPGDRHNWIDLRPYANTAPYTVNETASIQRTYRLFRTLGLRFLCVVNYNNQLVGIITRDDLLPKSLWNAIMRGRSAHLG